MAYLTFHKWLVSVCNIHNNIWMVHAKTSHLGKVSYAIILSGWHTISWEQVYLQNQDINIRNHAPIMCLEKSGRHYYWMFINKPSLNWHICESSLKLALLLLPIAWDGFQQIQLAIAYWLYNYTCRSVTSWLIDCYLPAACLQLQHAGWQMV